MRRSVGWLQTYLAVTVGAGLTVAGYRPASRAISLLTMVNREPVVLSGIADASAAKQGRCLPGSRIPIVPPKTLAHHPAHRVLLFVANLLKEVRDALPEVEAAGGRRVVLEPGIMELPLIVRPADNWPANDRWEATEMVAGQS